MRSPPSAVVFDAERAPLVAAPAERLGITQIAFDADAAAGESAPLVERDAADPAVILFTSGTSGVSKGAVLTHGSIGAAARNAAEALGFRAERRRPRRRAVLARPRPVDRPVATLATGGAVAVVPRFDPVETLALWSRRGRRCCSAFPTMCIALCDAARSAPALPPLRLAHVGGAPRAGRGDPRLRGDVRRRRLRGLRADGDLRDRDDLPHGRAAEGGLGRPPARGHRAEDRHARRRRRRGRRGRRGAVPRLERDPAATGGRSRASRPTAGSRPATSATSTTTATCSSSTGSRT